MVDIFGRQVFESVWLSVQERLPEPNEYVILSLNDGFVLTEWWDNTHKLEAYRKPTRYFLDDHEVLAWMKVPDFYIPPPVKEKKKPDPPTPQEVEKAISEY